MDLNLKPYYWLLLGVVITFVLIGLIGNIVIPDGVSSPFWLKAGPYIAFALFILFAAALVPISLKGFLIAQHKIGNSGLPMVQLISQHIRYVVIAVWAFFGLGLAIALPFMLKDGFFDQAEDESPVNSYVNLPNE
ncbi:hypothetical protein [Spirosoma sp. KNUC1025]|uniref:hypothetical protein n=1 Tax=Spirosoma sp. KNUC1025 TaxID=2894082 RepID=UPI0038657BC7|nr:hypothetical protein LN737_25305 [Spirosoma sp. KNUC1025]